MILGCVTAVYTQNIFACDANIDILAKAVMKKNNVPGVAIAIVAKDKKVEYCNYGYANKDKKTPVSQYTIFEIASITKTFTATLAAIASVQGEFNLADPINNYVPELATNKSFNDINAQELLSHTAGMPSNLASAKNSPKESDFFAEFSQWKSNITPGTNYQYGNTGINLVGFALERIYHQRYSFILQTQLLKKLHMKFTFLNVPKQYQYLMATGYDAQDKPTKYTDFGELVPAGGLKSNTYDLTKYLQLQIAGSNDKIINNALQIAHKNYYCLTQEGTYQQLAWVYHSRAALNNDYSVQAMIAAMKSPAKLASNCTYDSNGFIEKTGNMPGVSAYIAYLPKQKIGVVVLMNKGAVSDNVNLGRAILRYKLMGL